MTTLLCASSSMYWVMDGCFWQTSDILYYEILDIPLPELQGLKTLKVAFHHSKKDEVSKILGLVWLCSVGAACRMLYSQHQFFAMWLMIFYLYNRYLCTALDFPNRVLLVMLSMNLRQRLFTFPFIFNSPLLLYILGCMCSAWIVILY